MQDLHTNPLTNELNNIVKDLETLMHMAASTTNEKAEEMRRRGTHIVDSAVDKTAGVRTKARMAALSTNDIVHESPWRAVFAVTAAGLVIGALLARRRESQRSYSDHAAQPSANLPHTF